MFDRQAFYRFILDRGVIGIFDEAITLKSGRKSHWYFNWRNPMANVLDAKKVAEFVLDFVDGIELLQNCFYGVPEGATKLGIICNMLFPWHDGRTPSSSAVFLKPWHTEKTLIPGTFFPLPMGRAKPKDHGDPKDRFFVGAPEGAVIVLEDVTTTGGSLLTTIKALKEAEIKIVAAIGLTNRMARQDDGRSVKEAVENLEGIPYHHMSSALDLLPMVIEEKKISKKIVDFIVDEFERFGVERLEL